MQKQIYSFIVNFFSSFLCYSKKGFNTQQNVLTPADNWIRSLYSKGLGGALFMSLSQDFDNLNLDL